MRRAEHIGQALTGLSRGIDVELSAGPVDRREEGKTLDVVPVEVGQEAGCPEGAVEGLSPGELTEPGPEIEQQRRFAVRVE